MTTLLIVILAVCLIVGVAGACAPQPTITVTYVQVHETTHRVQVLMVVPPATDASALTAGSPEGQPASVRKALGAYRRTLELPS